ncbi:MAG TPA: hypothetical protein VF766_15720, partial [Pyrinomonadaceae bacterium]
AALLLVAITYALVSNFGSNKAAELDKADKLATKDTGSTVAPTIPVVEQMTFAPDNSEITTTTDSSGVKTETRTFKSHTRISKVVVTNSNGRQTARLFLLNGDERELPEGAIPTALEATGDELATIAGLMNEKVKSPAPDAKVASRKAVPPVKESPKNSTEQKLGLEPHLQSGEQSIPTQSPDSKRGSQSRAAGLENMTPIDRTADGAKKRGSKN